MIAERQWPARESGRSFCYRTYTYLRRAGSAAGEPCQARDGGRGERARPGQGEGAGGGACARAGGNELRERRDGAVRERCGGAPISRLTALPGGCVFALLLAPGNDNVHKRRLYCRRFFARPDPSSSPAPQPWASAHAPCPHGRATVTCPSRVRGQLRKSRRQAELSWSSAHLAFPTEDGLVSPPPRRRRPPRAPTRSPCAAARRHLYLEGVTQISNTAPSCCALTWRQARSGCAVGDARSTRDSRRRRRARRRASALSARSTARRRPRSTCRSCSAPTSTRRRGARAGLAAPRGRRRAARARRRQAVGAAEAGRRRRRRRRTPRRRRPPRDGRPRALLPLALPHWQILAVLTDSVGAPLGEPLLAPARPTSLVLLCAAAASGALGCSPRDACRVAAEAPAVCSSAARRRRPRLAAPLARRRRRDRARAPLPAPPRSTTPPRRCWAPRCRRRRCGRSRRRSPPTSRRRGRTASETHSYELSGGVTVAATCCASWQLGAHRRWWC